MIKTTAVAAGLLCAAAFSQYPEFTQQYTQRLAGQVDALTQVVTDFETSAMRSGLTRTQALAEMTGSPFLDDRQSDMRRTFARHAALSYHLDQLRAASPMEQLTMPHRLLDTQTFNGTLVDYKPAVPLTLAGLIMAGVGFVLGATVMGGLLRLITSPFRRRRSA